MKKIRVGVLFGGRSNEHEVSLVSATSIINSLDKDKYEIIPIGISKEGKWLSSENTLKLLKENNDQPFKKNEKILLPDPGKKGLTDLNKQNPNDVKIDVIIPIIHGLYGEDGTIQGLLELANIPYVGSGVLASAVGMDKIIQKNLFREAKIKITDFIWFSFSSYNKDQKGWIEKIENKIGYPNFIKPANSGSSIGINKSHNRKELIEFITEASNYDRKIMVEKAVESAREIEVSVLGNDDPIASLPGEVIPSNEFYDYDAKYIDGKSKSIIPAELPEKMLSLIQEIAIEAYKCLDCEGMARVDFLISAIDNEIYLNEINTIPGFTSISMYPKLWQASGISYPELLDKLIQLALQRFESKSVLKTTYSPKSKWYNG